MTVDESGIDKFILSLFPDRHAVYIKQKVMQLRKKWVIGYVDKLFCVLLWAFWFIWFLIVGLFTTNVEYAATIALVAGFTELIPYVGPFLAWIIALPVVANQSLCLLYG